MDVTELDENQLIHCNIFILPRLVFSVMDAKQMLCQVVLGQLQRVEWNSKHSLTSAQLPPRGPGSTEDPETMLCMLDVCLHEGAPVLDLP